jgi:hypothetical protein
MPDRLKKFPVTEWVETTKDSFLSIHYLYLQDLSFHRRKQIMLNKILVFSLDLVESHFVFADNGIPMDVKGTALC